MSHGITVMHIVILPDILRPHDIRMMCMGILPDILNVPWHKDDVWVISPGGIGFH